MRICYPIREKIIPRTCPYEWRVLNRMGEEANYGQIWATCCDQDCSYVLKYLAYNNDNTKEVILNEISIQNECSELGLCPQIHEAWFCDEGGAIVMDLVHITAANMFLKYKTPIVRQMILANIIVLLEKLHIRGIYHGDLHLHNIMIRHNTIIKHNGENSGEETEEENYELKEFEYLFIDFGKGGKFERMDDPHIYRDYDQILGHLLDLCDENPDDTGLTDIVKTMKIHMKRFD